MSVLPDPIDPREFDWVSQNGHDLAGICAVLLPIAFLGSWWVWRVGAAALLILFAAGKEFIWDRYKETPSVRGNSYKDFGHYVWPCLATLVLYQAKLLIWGP